MTMLLILLLTLQNDVISAKAGLVTFTDGVVDVGDRKHVGEGEALTTGFAGRAEFMLNPDSYLRMLDDSQVVLESDSLERIVVRLVEGSAIVDVEEVDSDMPIRIRVGNMDALILKDGLYLFEEDRLWVLDGEIRIEATDMKVKKDRFVSWVEPAPGDGDLEAVKFEEPPDSALLAWNQRRARRVVPPRVRRPRTPIWPDPNGTIPF